MVEAMGADIVDVNLDARSKSGEQGGGSNLLRDLPLMGKFLKQ